MEGVVIILITFVGFLFILFALTWRDVWYGLKRFIDRQSCDVYIVTKTKSILNYYMRPDPEGRFKIRGKSYIGNPDKIMSLEKDLKDHVGNVLKERKKAVEERLLRISNKVALLKKVADNEEQSDETRFNAEKQLVVLDQQQQRLKSLLNLKHADYIQRKRNAYFFLEGDPIAKDFMEIFSGMDCQLIDNLVSGEITKNPLEIDEAREFLILKVIIFGSGVISLITLIVLFNLQTKLQNTGII